MDLALARSIRQTREALSSAKDATSFQALLGFDGFVDEIIDVVDKRASFEEYTRIETIKEFSERIGRAAGLSTNLELVPRQVKIGGNGPIMGNALLAQGVAVSYIGVLGYPEIHPIFHDFADRCQEVYSLADPAHTDALEFADGKLMLGKLQTLKEATWETMLSVIGLDQIVKLFSQADLIASVNWTMLPNLTDIWQHLLADIWPRLTDRERRRWLFVDLADPEKRSEKDIKEALATLEGFQRHCRVILGLNRKEAGEIAAIFGLQQDDDLASLTGSLAEKLDVYCVVVHPTAEAAAVVDGEYYHTLGPFTSKPRLTTGAGDNFNAGFCLGMLSGLTPLQALVVAAATSGYYVRKMRSPTADELLRFLDRWAENAGEDF